MLDIVRGKVADLFGDQNTPSSGNAPEHTQSTAGNSSGCIHGRPVGRPGTAVLHTFMPSKSVGCTQINAHQLLCRLHIVVAIEHQRWQVCIDFQPRQHAWMLRSRRHGHLCLHARRLASQVQKLSVLRSCTNPSCSLPGRALKPVSILSLPAHRMHAAWMATPCCNSFGCCCALLLTDVR